MARRPAFPMRFASSPAPSGGLVIPTNDALANGFNPAERPPAQWVNWLLNATGAWLDYLRSADVATWRRTALGLTLATFNSLGADVDLVTAEGTTPLWRWVLAYNDNGTLRVGGSVRGDAWVQRNPTLSSAAITGLSTTDVFLVFSGAHWVCAYTSGGVGAIITTTPDGVGGSAITSAGDWSPATLPGTPGTMAALAVDDTTSRVTVAAAAAVLYWSSDDSGYTAATLATSPVSSGTFTDVAWTGSYWLAVTNKGELFRAGAASGTWSSVNGGSPWGNGTWHLGIGPSGEVLAFKSGSSWLRSTDHGATWASITAPFPSVFKVRYRDNQWLALTSLNAPYLATASDLTGPWARCAVPVAEDGTPRALWEVLYGEGQLLAVGGTFTLVGLRERAPAGGTWVPTTAPMPLMDAAYLRGVPIDSTTPTTGQVLTFDGTKWKPGAGGGGGASAPLYGILGARPSAGSGNAGALYYATDTGDLYACEKTGASTYSWRIVTVARARAVGDEIIACSADVSSGDLTNAGSAGGSLVAGTDAAYGAPSPLGGLAVRGTGADLSRWRGCAGAGYGATAKAMACWVRSDIPVINGWIWGVEYDPAAWVSPWVTFALALDESFGTTLRVVAANGSSYWSTNTGYTMPLHQWVHVAASLVYSGGTLTVKVWINGLLATTATQSSSGIGETAASHWSACSDPLTAGGEGMKGCVADLRAWSRAVTDAEVREFYQRGCGTWLG